MTRSEEIALNQPAGLLPRIGAALYDGMLLVALFFIGAAMIDPLMPRDHVPAGTWWFQLYLLVIAGLFYGWFWTHGGQTLGMRAWRLRVVNQAGGAIRWPQAVFRFSVAVPAWLSVIGVLWCAYDGYALHDRASRTRVVRLPKG